MFLLVKVLLYEQKDLYMTTTTYYNMKFKQNKSFFLKQFGDTPQLRVLDFLIDNYSFDFPMTIIAKESNVSYNSIIKFFSNFIDSKIITKTRKVGKSDYYKLNLDNLFVKNLMRLDWILTKNNTLKELDIVA